MKRANLILLVYVVVLLATPLVTLATHITWPGTAIGLTLAIGLGIRVIARVAARLFG